MEKKEVLFKTFKIKNHIKFLILIFLLSGCQIFLPKRNTNPNLNSKEGMVYPQSNSGSNSNPSNKVNSNGTYSEQNSNVTDNNSSNNGKEANAEVMVKPNTSAIKTAPKFGIILSGGGARVWAHLGILKELQKLKFPIQSIAGVEWGSVVAALFAQNSSTNEVEWELTKFKDLEDWLDFTKTVFSKKSTLDFKIPFVCPSLNLKNKTNYLLNRGQVDQLIPFCIPSAGLVKPYGNSVAYFSGFDQIKDHLKATGANRIIFINVISSKNEKSIINSFDSAENQLWTQYASEVSKKNINVDDIIEIDLSDYTIDQFKSRKDIMVKGAELGYNQIKRLTDKYKL